MQCPNCNKEIDNDSQFCKFCGAEFVCSNAGDTTIYEFDDAFAQTEPVEVFTEDVINDNIVFPEQTSEKEEDSSKKKNASPKKRKKLVIQLAVIIAVLVLICIGLICVGVSTGKFSFGETVTDAEGEKVYIGKGKTEITVIDSDGQKKEIETDRALLTPEQILAEYTLVMNQLKTDAPAFDFIRYQNMPEDKLNSDVMKFVLPIIEKYVTSKNVAETVTVEAGNAAELPIKDSSLGCVLKDADKIEKAYCEIIDDETYKLVIVLKDELNPSALAGGATSTAGTVNGVFPLYEAGKLINAISSTVNSDIDFNYTDCTVEIVYDVETKKVKSLNMTMYIDITAEFFFNEITAQIVDISEYTGFKY